MSTLLPQPVSAPLPSSRKVKFHVGLREVWGHFTQRLQAQPPSGDSLPGLVEHEDGSLSEPLDREKRSPNFSPRTFDNLLEDDDQFDVNAVVVDNTFDIYANPPDSSNNSVHHEETAEGTHKSATDAESQAERESVHPSYWPKALKNWQQNTGLSTPRFIWLAIQRFGNQTHHNPDMETQFCRERWYTSKKLCLLGGLWLVANWVMAVGFAKRPFNGFDYILFYVLGPLFTIPIPVMVIFDLPECGTSWVYTLWLTVGVWLWGISLILDVYLCGFFGTHKYMSCVDKNFFNLIYYACALPAISVFAQHQNRAASAFSVVIFLGLMFGLVVPARASLIRHAFEILVFHGFLLYVSYMREKASRRVFLLKEQIKVQYRATQKAQIAERRSADSKRRLTSYIFHEVRVPLNTATLAFQNIEAQRYSQSEYLNSDDDLEFTALGGSLSMMSKVLSDILDFNRMDAGRFESIAKPYNFHKALRSMIPGTKTVADARGIQIKMELDPRIDILARRAMYAAQGLNEHGIQQRLSGSRATTLDLERRDDEDEGIVVGDEMRLRQVVTNLTSNALKFTRTAPDSRVTIRTRLVLPSSTTTSSGPKVTEHKAGAPSHDSAFEETVGPTEEVGIDLCHLDNIVVRIEVQDTGVGIRGQDMLGQRLFSPYVQTDIGRSQGGKGTGLGLALVRHIVALSKGRLGVISKHGVGSTFWVELSLGVGRRALVPMSPNSASHQPTPVLGEDWPCVRVHLPALPTPSTFEPERTPSVLSPRPPFSRAPSDYLGAHDIPPRSGPSEKGTPESSRVPLNPNSTIMEMPEPEKARHKQAPDPANKAEKEAPESIPLQTIVNPSNNPSIVVEPDPIEADVPKPENGPGLTSEVELEQSDHPNLALQSPEAGASKPVTKAPRPSYITLPAPFSPLEPMHRTPALARASSGKKSSGGKTPAHEQGDRVGGGLSVLVVDDDLLTRRLMSRMLGRLGCQTETAENGHVALTLLITGERVSPDSVPVTPLLTPKLEFPIDCDVKARQNRFDIVFLDNQMPVLTGVEVARQMRAFGRRDFIVGVTGNALKEDQREYLDAGADHLLTKPVREESLREMLILARKRLEPSPTPSPSTPVPQPIPVTSL